MEMILLIGIPGSGKSSFYKKVFFHSHIRISLDMLRTRNREAKLMDFCFSTSMPFVIDNTNVSVEERNKYIESARRNKYQIYGYYFKADVKKCVDRNNRREGKEKVNEIAIFAKYKELQIPDYSEGFDKLMYVEAKEENNFEIKDWQDEI